VARLRKGFTRLPPMRAVGSLGDEALAQRVGALIGRELRAVGVDVNFAPVLDIDTNPKNPIIGNRSLSREPDVVARLGVALGRGIEAEGVAACGKHFPGHGDTAQDSHQELPRLQHSRARLEEVELVPFRAWVLAKLASIMTAHVIFEPIDADYPATMSRPVLHGILREAMGYEGLIVTDDIEMKAIADHYGYDEAAIRGVLAGVDNFLCCHTADVAHQLIETVAGAVESGRVPLERLVEANQRMATFTERWAQPARAPRLEVLASDAHLALVEELLTRVDPALADLGEDPTEIMERIRVERMREKGLQP
jgi:beta-N-acetylhexosaminidase